MKRFLNWVKDVYFDPLESWSDIIFKSLTALLWIVVACLLLLAIGGY